MHYLQPFNRFFGSPRWGMNLVLMSVCMFIPILGIFAVMGWMLQLMVNDLKDPDAPVPDFTFDRIMEDAKRGLVPFLVLMVWNLLLMPLMFIAFLPFIGILFEPPGEWIAVLVILTILLYFLALFVQLAVIVPVQVFSGLTQEFREGFAVGRMLRFVRLVGVELFLSQFCVMGFGFLFMMLGYLTCGIGFYPAMVLMFFMLWQHNGQLYRLYLERGGEALAIHPTLQGEPAPPEDPMDGVLEDREDPGAWDEANA